MALSRSATRAVLGRFPGNGRPGTARTREHRGRRGWSRSSIAWNNRKNSPGCQSSSAGDMTAFIDIGINSAAKPDGECRRLHAVRRRSGARCRHRRQPLTGRSGVQLKPSGEIGHRIDACQRTMFQEMRGRMGAVGPATPSTPAFRAMSKSWEVSPIMTVRPASKPNSPINSSSIWGCGLRSTRRHSETPKTRGASPECRRAPSSPARLFAGRYRQILPGAAQLRQKFANSREKLKFVVGG